MKSRNKGKHTELDGVSKFHWYSLSVYIYSFKLCFFKQANKTWPSIVLRLLMRDISLVFYLSHTLSLLCLIEGSGVKWLVVDKVRTLNVINGFDFGNGSEIPVIKDLIVYFCLEGNTHTQVHRVLYRTTELAGLRQNYTARINTWNT